MTLCPAKQGETDILKWTSEKTDEHLGTWGPLVVSHLKNMSMWRPKEWVLLFVFQFFRILRGIDILPSNAPLPPAFNKLWSVFLTRHLHQNANENLWVTKRSGAHLARSVPPCTSACFHHSFCPWQHRHFLSAPSCSLLLPGYIHHCSDWKSAKPPFF